MKPSGTRSSARGWWFREAIEHDPGPPAAALAGHRSADVVVVGGGYTGMWTAHLLSEREPGLRVVLLEAEECGAGPSGRNGGFVTGWWDELPTLVDLYGSDGALAACRALDKSIDGIGEWTVRHGADAWFRRKGYLQVASSPAQDGAW
jgi:glycine/D-amino acid oxidase-like deaminating enzyme